MKRAQQHLTDEEIAIYAEALVANNYKQLDKSIREHVKICDECAVHIMQVYEIISGASIEKNDVRRFKLSPPPPKYWLGIAAGLLVLMGIGVWQFQVQSNSALDDKAQITENEDYNPPADQSSQGDEQFYSMDAPLDKEKSIPALIASPEDTLPGGFTYMPHPKFEQLIGKKGKNNAASESIHVTSPQSLSIDKGATATLQWEKNSNKEVTVELYTNRGKLLKNATTTDSRYKLASFSNKGLFYWKLTNGSNQLYFCGKIRVK